MKATLQLYKFTSAWIFYSKTTHPNPQIREEFNIFRDEFGELERKVFGDTHLRINNPVAMKYDKVRNILVRYLGDEDFSHLKLAEDIFSEIPNPDLGY
ncbi:MAG: hypothetical protein AABW81_03980 [Nanoarchaeota archaeon]